MICHKKVLKGFISVSLEQMQTPWDVIWGKRLCKIFFGVVLVDDLNFVQWTWKFLEPQLWTYFLFLLRLQPHSLNLMDVDLREVIFLTSMPTKVESHYFCINWNRVYKMTDKISFLPIPLSIPSFCNCIFKKPWFLFI